MVSFLPSDVIITPLTKAHSRKSFDCGQADLNAFVRQYAMQQQRQGYNQGYAAVSGAEVVGFYCLSAASLALDELPPDFQKASPRYPVPCICLGNGRGVVWAGSCWPMPCAGRWRLQGLLEWR